jgi:hypothetical protein
MRVLIGLVVVAAIGVAVFFVVRSDEKPTKQTDALRSGSAAITPPPPTKPPAPASEVSEQQEAAERKLIEDFARDQTLTIAETGKLLASLKAMQDGRRAGFADFKDRKILIEDLSARLRELRMTMNRNFENDLGKARADSLIERMRIAAGGESRSPK